MTDKAVARIANVKTLSHKQLLLLQRNQGNVVMRNGLEAVIAHEWSRMLARVFRAHTPGGDLSEYNGTVTLIIESKRNH